MKIDEAGVKSSLGHGIGRKKAIAYKAVPDVIENGLMIYYQVNWKGRNYDTAVLVAPIQIADIPYYMGVIVNVYKNDNAFYLHEVLLQNKKDETSFKTGTRKGSPGEASSSLFSLLQKVSDVKDQSYSLRDQSATEARTLLSNALTGAAQNDVERKNLKRYQADIDAMTQLQERLEEINDE